MDFSRDELKEFEGKLLAYGYRKYEGHREDDYSWWKSFDVTKDADGNREVGYQIAFLVYDFSNLRPDHTFGVQCKFLIGARHNIGRVDMLVSNDDMSVEKFEQLCKRFYAFVLDNFEVNNKNK